MRQPELWEERIFDTNRRSYIPIRAERLMHHKVLNSPVICVGEVHTDVTHHMAELEILKVQPPHHPPTKACSPPARGKGWDSLRAEEPLSSLTLWRWCVMCVMCVVRPCTASAVAATVWPWAWRCSTASTRTSSTTTCSGPARWPRSSRTPTGTRPGEAFEGQAGSSSRRSSRLSRCLMGAVAACVCVCVCRGHKLFHYAKILQYAKTHGIRLVGLNVPIPVVQVGGTDASLPASQPASAAEREKGVEGLGWLATVRVRC